MKKLFVLIVLIAGLVWGAEAQSKGITFEQTKEWKKVLKKAKKEKRLIFIDCYTSWCGPCKMLSSQVFTREDVGNQFNADFVPSQLWFSWTRTRIRWFIGWLGLVLPSG